MVGLEYMVTKVELPDMSKVERIKSIKLDEDPYVM
jgi:hypothetical protein